jgi:hypothetical protein
LLLRSEAADRIESAFETGMSKDFNVLSMITDVASFLGGLEDTICCAGPKHYGVMRAQL